MNYKTKDIVGMVLEVGAIVSLAVAVKYDCGTGIIFSCFGYSVGRDLRDDALQEKIESRIRKELADKL